MRQADLSPLQVTARQGESPERTVRRFVRKVREDGVLRLYRKKSSFVKPSQKRREKRRSHNS